MDNTDPQQNLTATTPQDTTTVTPQPLSQSVTSSPWQIPPTAPTPPVVVVPSPWQTSAAPTAPVIQTPPAMTPPVQTPSTEQISPWQSTPAMPQTSVEAQPTNTASPLAEPPLPISKKAGIPRPVMAGLMLFLVAGIAGGTFLLSRGVSSSKPVAPNAPSSEPKAFDPNEGTPTGTANGVFEPNGKIDCTGIPNTAPYGNKCIATVILPNGEETWAPGAIEAIGFEK